MFNQSTEYMLKYRTLWNENWMDIFHKIKLESDLVVEIDGISCLMEGSYCIR